MNTIVLLTSGMGLGVYVPALLLRNQLERQGLRVMVCVYENYLSEEKRENVQRFKERFHQSFRAAVAGHKMPLRVSESLDHSLVHALTGQWEEANCRLFLMLSGHWNPVLDAYRKKHTGCYVECLRMDAGITPSWKLCPEIGENWRTTWLFGREKQAAEEWIPVDNRPPVPFEERPHRVMAHGGGWGMGTYRNKIAELQTLGDVDLALYDPAEADCARRGDRCFLMDPVWKPWHTDSAGRHLFPPTREVGKESAFSASPESPYLYEIFRQERAIVSKPGGGTLLDAISAATPLIFLEPIAEHERENAAQFEAMGCGISWESWKESRFSDELLLSMHRRLLALRKSCRSYLPALLERWRNEGCFMEGD